MTSFRLAAGVLCVVIAGSAPDVSFAQQASPPQQPPAAKPAAPKAAEPPKAAAPKSATAKPAAPAPTSTGAATDTQPTLLGQYADWGAYTAAPGGGKICFVLAKPKTSKTEPLGRSRNPAYMFVSTRPTESVKNEVSVVVGYPFKTSSDATAEIGNTKFAMYTKDDGAWIKNVNEEARMVEAMRKGGDLTVKGTSGRGTQSTDQYSLKGLAQALDKIEQECR
jgi:hypothetical protein